MKFYVFVLGPYDSIFVGPFDTELAAQAHAENIVPSNLDAYVMSEIDMKKNIQDHGEIHVETP